MNTDLNTTEFFMKAYFVTQSSQISRWLFFFFDWFFLADACVQCNLHIDNLVTMQSRQIHVNKILAYSPEPPRTSATTSTELSREIEEGQKQEGRRGKVSRERRRKINVVNCALERAVFSRSFWSRRLSPRCERSWEVVPPLGNRVLMCGM